MFEVISTGKNTCYRNKGEKIKIGDSHVIFAIQEGWIKPGTLKYLGNSKFYRGQGIKEKEVAVMPERKVWIINELKMQTKAYGRILKELSFIEKKKKRIEKSLYDALEVADGT